MIIEILSLEKLDNTQWLLALPNLTNNENVINPFQAWSTHEGFMTLLIILLKNLTLNA